MKVKKRCPACQQPVVVPGNVFTEFPCPSCGTTLYVDHGTFTQAGAPPRFSPENRQKSAFASTAWLLRGLFNSLPGILSLQQGRLSYTALDAGTFWKRGLKRLENDSKHPGLAARLRRGEAGRLFDLPREEIQDVSFPWFYFSAGMHIGIDGRRYRFSFIRPNNTQMPVVNRSDARVAVGLSIRVVRDINEAMEVGRRWKLLLDEREKDSGSTPFLPET